MSSSHPAGGALRDRTTLIDRLTADAVASDYPEPMPFPEAQPPPARESRRQQVLVAASALALAGFVLALGLSSRVLSEPVVSQQRADLLTRIGAASASRDALAAAAADLGAQITEARTKDLQQSSAGALLADRVTAAELATGLIAARGPGVRVTLTNPEPDPDQEDSDIARVLDSDMQSVVNGLWAAGAEAIAINGQRLTARSAIRSAAGAILVNYRPLTSPYEVEAIGDPDRLRDSFLATPDVAELTDITAQYGIGFDTAQVDRLDLPAGSTALPELAEVIPSAGGGAS